MFLKWLIFFFYVTYRYIFTIYKIKIDQHIL